MVRTGGDQGAPTSDAAQEAESLYQAWETLVMVVAPEVALILTERMKDALPTIQGRIVERLHGLPYSWEEIGGLLGKSGNAMHMRFKGRVKRDPS